MKNDIYIYIYIYIYKNKIICISVLRTYHSVHTDWTTFTRCFQNTMYIDIGCLLMSCLFRILVTIELLSELSHFFLYSI